MASKTRRTRGLVLRITPPTESPSVDLIVIGYRAFTESKGAMAEEGNKNSYDSSMSKVNQNKEETEKLPKKLPPPPEKPLPGDCCGSGCVWCVWDIYYEELEDYNKLLSESKSNSDSN